MRITPSMLTFAFCLAGLAATAHAQELRRIRVAQPIAIGLANDTPVIGQIRVCDAAGKELPKGDDDHDPFLAQDGDYYTFDKAGTYTLRIEPKQDRCSFDLGFFNKDKAGKVTLRHGVKLTMDSTRKFSLVPTFKAKGASDPGLDARASGNALFIDIP
jgi:hypothetical protein